MSYQEPDIECYITFPKTEEKWKWELDDKEEIPDRIPLEELKFDYKTKVLTGKITFESEFENDLTWEYIINLSTNLQEVQSGKITFKDATGDITGYWKFEKSLLYEIKYKYL